MKHLINEISVNTVYAEITNQCNLNCYTCYNRSGLNCQRQELSLLHIEKILHTFTKYGLQRLIFSGGEPTLHTEFSQILDLVDKYPHISFGITTNGTIHHSKLITYLNTRANLKLQISLDGSCEDQNAIIRGTDNFAKTVSFAKQILHSKEPRLKMVITQQNYLDVMNFCKLALSLGFIPDFSFIYCAGNATIDWESKMLTTQQKIKAQQQISQFCVDNNMSTSHFLCSSCCPLSHNLQGLSLCIKADGSIHPCQLLYDKTYRVGDLTSFDEAYFTEKLTRIISLSTKRLSRDYGCSKCLLQKGCQKGCMALAVLLHKNPLDCDEECEYRKLHFLQFVLDNKNYWKE